MHMKLSGQVNENYFLILELFQQRVVVAPY